MTFIFIFWFNEEEREGRREGTGEQKGEQQELREGGGREGRRKTERPIFKDYN